jgi:hypothetical protein
MGLIAELVIVAGRLARFVRHEVQSQRPVFHSYLAGINGHPVHAKVDRIK